MAYCMYLRKSRADKDYENLSTETILNRHEKALMELAQKHNYDISKIFREVVSGETLSQRPPLPVHHHTYCLQLHLIYVDGSLFLRE